MTELPPIVAPPEPPPKAPEPVPVTSAEAFAIEARIKATCASIRASWAQLSEQVYAFHHGRAWDALGYDTLEEWLASPDVEMSRRQFFYLVDAWRTLVVMHDVPPAALESVDLTKAQEVLSAVRNGVVSAEKALADCEHLSRSDLREEYRDLVPANSAGRREGFDETNLRWGRCDTCGSRIRLLVKEDA